MYVLSEELTYVVYECLPVHVVCDEHVCVAVFFLGLGADRFWADRDQPGLTVFWG